MKTIIVITTTWDGFQHNCYTNIKTLHSALIDLGVDVTYSYLLKCKKHAIKNDTLIVNTFYLNNGENVTIKECIIKTK